MTTPIETPTTANPKDLELVVIRFFRAPRPLVFDSLTQGEHLAKWSCPRGFTMVGAGADPRVSGRWWTTMRAPDGEICRATGIYREISPFIRVVKTQGWRPDDESEVKHETIVTMTLSDHPGGDTKIVLHQGRFATVESRDLHDVGWNESLDKMAEYMAAVPADEAMVG